MTKKTLLAGACTLALLIAGLAAGLVPGVDIEQEAPVVGSTSSDVAPFVYACPNPTAFGTPCASRAGPERDAAAEPSIAIHPTDAAIMALGVNAGTLTQPIEQDGARVVALPMTVAGFYVTTDAGATWNELRLPTDRWPANIVAGRSVDPQVAFGPDGRLYVAGIVHDVTLVATALILGPQQGFQSYLFVAASNDLGATWDALHVFDNRYAPADREWLSVGPDGTAYLTWSVSPVKTSEVAWSADGGATWQLLPESQAPSDCRAPGPVAIHKGEPIFGCFNNNKGVRAHRLDTATATLTPLGWAKAGTAPYPIFASMPDGTLAMAPMRGLMKVKISHDDGENWPETLVLGPGIVLHGEKIEVWDTAWLSADAWGNLHALVLHSTAHDPVWNAAWTHETYHYVFDTAGTVLQRTLLSNPDATAVNVGEDDDTVADLRKAVEETDPDRLVASTQLGIQQNDVLQMAFTPDHGILVWTEGPPDSGTSGAAAVWITRIEPASPEITSS